MDPGKLREWIEIFAPPDPEARDSHGQPAAGGALVAACWAAQESAGGGEFVSADQVKADLSAAFLIRQHPGVRPHCSLVWEGSRYEVLHVGDADERRMYSRLLCRALEGGAEH